MVEMWDVPNYLNLSLIINSYYGDYIVDCLDFIFQIKKLNNHLCLPPNPSRISAFITRVEKTSTHYSKILSLDFSLSSSTYSG